MSKFQSGAGMIMSYGGWTPVDEAVEKECPFCHGTNTTLVGYADEAHGVENYLCWGCEVNFEVEVEIPF